VLITLTTTQHLTIMGKGKNSETLIQGVGALNPAIRISSFSNVSIENLILMSSGAADGVAALEILGDSSNVTCNDVRGMASDDVGVELGPDTLGVLLENCEFSGMSQRGFIIDGRSHSLMRCTADACGLNGFLFAEDSANCLVHRCRAAATGGSDPTNTGVIDVNGTGHLIRDSEAHGGLDGFAIRGSGHRLHDCEAGNHSGSAFKLVGQAHLSECSGIQSLVGFSGGGDGCLIEGGSFQGNASHGLQLDVDGTAVREATANNNGGHGIEISADGCLVYDCSFNKNGGEAVTVTPAGSSNWLEANKAKGDDGFVDQGNGNAGRDNKVKNGVNDF
jgi:hypothetical protein